MGRLAMREKFEDAAFNKRFMMSIQRTGLDGPLTFMSVDCPTQEELCRKREDGHYVDQTMNAMWWAWQAAYAAGMDRAAEICDEATKLGTVFVTGRPGTEACADAIRAEIKGE